MLDFLLKILAIDSTSGKENVVADYVVKNYKPKHATTEVQRIFNGKKNVFFKWGIPHIIFCSHLDTVPPYIPFKYNGKVIYGRGSCDAKGQIASMYEACSQLCTEGKTNFGLLMVAGEEVGSYGAKLANQLITGCKYIIIGEPTENKLIRAAKGNLLVNVAIKGKSSHSGYPQYGDDAVARLRVFLNKLTTLKFPKDRVLGATTYNIGKLSAPNMFNITPDKVTCEIFFRTTFKTHDLIIDMLKPLADEHTILQFGFDNRPIEFYTIPGFATNVVSFGSDAPELYNLGKSLLYGAGSILTAHADNEHIKVRALERAVQDFKKIFYYLTSQKGVLCAKK
ncbi:M20_dimer domain-containing protein [Gammaproteobacteria bacterium]